MRALRPFPQAVPTLLLAGLALVAGAAASPAQEAPAPDARATPRFEGGEAQIVPEFQDEKAWIRHDLWVETPVDCDGDGKLDRVHVDVTRQEQTEREGLRVAVVYETSPYYRGTASGHHFFWDPKHALGSDPPARVHPAEIDHDADAREISRSLVREWLPRGFAVVHSCSPGTGRSQGCPTIGGENESLAPKSVIDWLNGRAKGYSTPYGDEEVVAYWATGKVGMIGTSYNGTLPLAAATTGVEGLEAIIPISPNTSYYHYYRSHGLIRHPGGYMGEDIDVLYDFVHSGAPEFRATCNATIRDGLLVKGFDRRTGDYNPFWAGRDYLNSIDAVRAATLIAHGFNDWNVMPGHSVRVFEALKARNVPCMAYFHQGGHGGPPPFRLQNRWFSRYLYGVENGIESDPRAYVVREKARRGEPTAYATYPHPDAAAVELHPTPGGRAVGALALDAAPGRGAETLVDDVAHDGAKLASAPASEHRLLYATPVLAKPVHLSGTAEITIRLASSAPAANLSVWLVSLPWTSSRSILDDVITRGWADPQNHASLTESAPLVPGEPVTLTFTLEPDDQIIPAGEQIGLMVFSSDRDFTLWPEPGTELTVDLDGTSLRLPVVGGRAAYEAALVP